MGRRAIDRAGRTSEAGGRAQAPVPPKKKTGFQRDASLWQVLEGSALEVLPFRLPGDSEQALVAGRKVHKFVMKSGNRVI